MRESIEVYEVNRMHKLLTLSVDCSLGRFCLSAEPEESLLAFSTDIITGTLNLYNLANLHQELQLHAHNSPIILMCFNQLGTLLATTSCKV
jgi:WD40 repeat protein